MTRQNFNISDWECAIWQQEQADFLLIQPVDEHDMELMENEIKIIGELTECRFTLVALKVRDWWSELTPWTAPPVFGKTPFGERAGDTLGFIISRLLPELEERGIYKTDTMGCLLGGYSLAGLFALWVGYQTDVFKGVAAVSPSVWYSRWIDYASVNQPRVSSVYLSMGDKEEKAKNAQMAQVGNAIRRQHELLNGLSIKTILEWNEGNHFVDSEWRTAKGFAWLMNNNESGLHD